MDCPKLALVDWLLEADNPSVRYFTLRDLLKRPSNDAELVSAKREIMAAGPVPKIVAKMAASEYAPMRKDFYGKYRGLSWQLLFLAELGAQRTAPIDEACEYLLSHSQEPEEGGFSMRSSAKSGGGLANFVIPCLTGNMVFSLIRLGYLDDPRVKKAIGWLAKYQRFDDGDGEPPSGWPYDRFEMCWGRHTCHMGAVKVLKAFAEIPEEDRSPEVARKITEGVEYILKHHIHKRSHDLSKVSRPGWTKFGFPLTYQTDVLEILEILLKLGAEDGRMQEAVDLVASKRDPSGKWTAESRYRGEFLVDIDGQGPDKWITMKALRASAAVSHTELQWPSL